MSTARFVIGIDLGTTNSAVAYADLRERTASGVPRLRHFPVPQIVGPHEIAPRLTLPSFLYLLPEEEQAAGRFTIAWDADRRTVIGEWARDQGALVPSRLVSSAKSWLCHGGVDRRAAILPWGSEDSGDRRSPVEASAAIVAHVRDAWNHAMAAGADALRFEHQQVVLGVPASFDEEARELTVEAAGLPQLALVEEPTAALYAWIAAHQGRLGDAIRDGDRLLVCDVGGGTTDFTLVSVRAPEGEEPAFERTAVGQHLLLGGDNLDLAVTRLVEEKLGRPRLTLRQQQGLRRQCAAAKERLLGPPPVDRVTVSVLGGGASLIGGTLATEITRAEVLSLLLDGFLPESRLDETPVVDRRVGLRELGLPFASDPAITRHLAAFLRDAGEGAPVRPDAILFNGGFFTPDEARERVTSVVAGWFADGTGWQPRVLANAAPAIAVAEGATYAGLVRHGHGVRIGGGSPRAFYLALGGEHGAGGRAVCLLARGAQEGGSWQIDDRAFTVQANRPLSFTLLSSLTRSDGVGDVVTLDADAVHRHAPLVTELRFGKRSRHANVRVLLEVHYTELGTLELWLVAPDTGHRWRLQFQLRALDDDTSERQGAAVADETLDEAIAIVRGAFAGDAPAAALDTLMARLEATFGFGKHAWPVGAVRPLADVLLELADVRARSARHEARWLNLAGYCLRPGAGATRDEWRMTQARRVYLRGLAFPADVQCQAEWLVLWQRVAAGLTPGQQQEMFDRHAALLGVGSTKKPRPLPPQVDRETWRLLASLEHVPARKRVALGDALVARLKRERRNASLVWALGRVGARTPVYGPLNTVVPPGAAAAWLEALLDIAGASADTAAACVQLGARTGDPARDLDEDVTRAAHARLVAAGHADEALSRLLEVLPPSEADRRQGWGESLPEGLRLAPSNATDAAPPE